MIPQTINHQPPVREIPQKDIKHKLIDLILTCYQLAGQKAIYSDGVVYSKFMSDEIQKNYKFLVWQEIAFAFERGVKGDYGEYYGINVKSMTQWLKAYTKSPERELFYTKNQKLKALPEATQPTEQEKREIIKAGIFRKFQEYKLTGYLSDPGNVSYGALENTGLISLTLEQKTVIKEKARSALLAQASVNQKSKKLGVAVDATTLIKAITTQNKSANELLKIESRNIALAQYFDTVQDVEQLTEIINNSTL